MEATAGTALRHVSGLSLVIRPILGSKGKTQEMPLCLASTCKLLSLTGMAPIQVGRIHTCSTIGRGERSSKI